MGTTTTNYALYKPNVGETAWGPSVNTSLDTIDTLLYNRVMLQASTPGTAQTGHANISGTFKSGAIDTGAITGAGLAAITRTSEQLRLLYDGSNYTSFTVSSGGDLTVAPTGGDTAITGTLANSGNVALNTSSGNVNIGAALGTAGGKLNVWDATEPLRLIYAAGKYASFVVDSSGNLTITPTGNIISPGTSVAIRTASYTSGVVGWSANWDGSAEFNNVNVRGELRASVFKIAELAASAGTVGVFYSAAALYEDVTTPAGTGSSYTLKAKNSDAGGMLFGVGDFCRMKTWTGSGISDAWFEVTARTNNTTYTTYTVTSRGSTGFSVTFRAGTAIADYGPSGTGFITLSSDGTVGSSPNLTMAKHAGTPWSGFTTLMRSGNLNGSYGYVVDTYGVGLGQYGAAGQTWLTADTTNGIRIGTNTTIVGQWDTSGTITVGQSGANNIGVSSTQLTLRYGSTAYASLDTSGVLVLGAIANSTNRIQMDPAAGLRFYNRTSGGVDVLRYGITPTGDASLYDSTGTAVITFDSSGASYFAGPMTIGTTGGIYQGSGTFASPTTGIKLWAPGSSTGKLAGYNGGTIQAYLDTDGKFYAGAGNVKLDAAGITLTGSSSNSYLAFIDNTNSYGATITISSAPDLRLSANTTQASAGSTTGLRAFGNTNSKFVDLIVTANSTTGASVGITSNTLTLNGLAVGASSPTAGYMLDVHGAAQFSMAGNTYLNLTGTSVGDTGIFINRNNLASSYASIYWRTGGATDWFVRTNATLSDLQFANGSGTTYMNFAATGQNIALFGTGSFGSGQAVLFIANRGAAPSGSPSGGGILYVESGALKYKGSSGTVTTVAPA